MIPVALTIAGSDSGGGAGIQGDLKTFQSLHVYATSAVTAVTAQNTSRISAVHGIPPQIVKDQIRDILSDFPVASAKTGMLHSAEIIKAIIEIWDEFYSHTKEIPLIVDPIMVSSTGLRLLNEDALENYIVLMKKAALITPNVREAEVLTGNTIRTLDEMEKAALQIHKIMKTKILVKGGHLPEEKSGVKKAVDIFFDGTTISRIESEWLDKKNTHGTGCTFSAACTGYLALGLSLEDSLLKAKHYVTEAIRNGPQLGSGFSPLNHMWQTKADLNLE